MPDPIPAIGGDYGPNAERQTVAQHACQSAACGLASQRPPCIRETELVGATTYSVQIPRLPGGHLFALYLPINQLAGLALHGGCVGSAIHCQTSNSFTGFPIFAALAL